MQLTDAFEYSMMNLKNSSLRTWLTVIGVIIGVVALVTITSVSEGVQRDIRDQLSAFGPNMMMVVPVAIDANTMSSMGGGVGQMATSGKLFERDATAIAGIPGVKSVSRLVMGKTSFGFKDKNITAMIVASDAGIFDQYKEYMKIETGRTFKDGERRVVVLGNDAANQLFGNNKIGVGSMVRINNQDFRVVGIMEKIGGSLGGHDDSMIIIPFDDGKDLFAKQLSRNEINMIYVELSNSDDAAQIKDSIDQKLVTYHKVTMDDKDFTVITSDFIQQTVGGVLTMLSAFLLLITLIASLVGAIGVANTMFMAVLERTKEIGVLKAIGASENDITLVFLIESVLISLVGGIIGLLLGAGILNIALSFGVPYWLRYRIILFALVFSVVVGVLAGALPARQASKLNAVDALNS